MPERRAGYLLGSALLPLMPLLIAWATGAALFGVLVRLSPISTEELVIDPNAFHSLPWYSGLVSNLGVLGWGSAAMASGAAYWVCSLGGRKRAQNAFGGGALLSTLLLLDDLFQLHIVVPKFIGMPKASFYAMYAVLTLGWLVTNWMELRRTRWQLLAASSIVLGGSIVADQVLSQSPSQLVIEDSLKFLGIVAWAQYFIFSAMDVARSVITSPGPGSGLIPPTNPIAAISSMGQD